ncbi:MAG: hypothetical protein R3251_00440 [Candidatus Spechtbacterales bacterium]|nr:hypothetical protein [Candidatus Spechtbacterales bacterium]
MKNIREEAKRVLLNNFEATGKRYITPAWPHYRYQWVWDSSFHAISASELGLDDIAKNEIRQLFKYQDSRGWIPHFIYHGYYAKWDAEMWLYGKGLRPKTSSLVGQPVIAQAVEAINDKNFSAEVAEPLVKFYKYFIEYRDAYNVVSIISHRESGRDAAPEFDFFRPVLPKRFNRLNGFLDFLFTLFIDFRNLLLGWDEEKILQRGPFNVKDVGEHTIFIDGLYSLKNILKSVDMLYLFPNIDEAIKRSINALIDTCWDKEDKRFYPVRVGHGMLKDHYSIGNIMPLIIKDLPREMVEGIVKDIKDPNLFWTKYPLPSVSVSDSEFLPDKIFPIWRGPTWINTNWFIIRALVQHGETDAAKEIAERSKEMIKRKGYWEFYDPYTGEGMRIEDFAWSTLVVTFDKLVEK